MKGFLREFREFAARGNVIDLAVGVVIGAAFGRITSSLVDDVFMPIFGALFGAMELSHWKIVLQPEMQERVLGIATGHVLQPEIAIHIGLLLAAILNFLLVAFAMFLLVKGINGVRRRAEALREPPALASPAPIRSPEERLLIEIRDLLKSGAHEREG